jgi:uncharacterized membrane protein YbhN (UPF0104 family)
MGFKFFHQSTQKALRAFLSILISLILFVYFYNILNKESFLTSLKGVSPLWILVGVILFFIQTVLKSFRFKFILDAENHRIRDLIGIQSIQIVFNNILPAWLGEFVLPYFFKKMMNIEYAESVSSIVVIRVVDLLISIILFVLLFTLQSGYIVYSPFSRSSVLWAGSGAVLLIIVTCLIGRNENLYQRLSKTNFMLTGPFGLRLKDFLIRINFYFKSATSLKTFTAIFFFSLIIYVVLYAVFVCVCQAIHANLSLTEVFFVYILIFPIEALPIRGFLNLGTYELAWVVALIMIGYSKADAILIAFGTHAVFLIYFAITAFMMLIIFRYSGFRRGSIPISRVNSK